MRPRIVCDHQTRWHWNSMEWATKQGVPQKQVLDPVAGVPRFPCDQPKALNKKQWNLACYTAFADHCKQLYNLHFSLQAITLPLGLNCVCVCGHKALAAILVINHPCSGALPQEKCIHYGWSWVGTISSLGFHVAWISRIMVTVQSWPFRWAFLCHQLKWIPQLFLSGFHWRECKAGYTRWVFFIQPPGI